MAFIVLHFLGRSAKSCLIGRRNAERKGTCQGFNLDILLMNRDYTPLSQKNKQTRGGGRKKKYSSHRDLSDAKTEVNAKKTLNKN